MIKQLKHILPIIIAFLTLTIPTSGQCIDGFLCASAASNLEMNAHAYAQAESEYEDARDEYENSCGAYGYSRQDTYACGQYGYKANELSRAETALRISTSSLSISFDQVVTSCAPPRIPSQKTVKRPQAGASK